MTRGWNDAAIICFEDDCTGWSFYVNDLEMQVEM